MDKRKIIITITICIAVFITVLCAGIVSYTIYTNSAKGRKGGAAGSTDSGENTTNSNEGTDASHTDDGDSDCSGMAAYQTYYYEALESMNPNDFNQDYCEFFKNGYYLVNGKVYESSKLYLVIDGVGEKHLVVAGDNNYDILMEKSFDDTSKGGDCFKRIQECLEYFEDIGLDEKGYLVIDERVLPYLEKSEAKRSPVTPEMAADIIASQRYEEEYMNQE